MAKTARELITDALRTTGAIGQIETPSANEVVHGLGELNGLIEQLDLDSLFPYTRTKFQFVTDGSSEYTIGNDPSADLEHERPNRIVSCSVLIDGSFLNIQEVTIDQFYDKYKVSESGYPAVFSYESNYPFGSLLFSPIPNGYTIEVRYQYKNTELGLDDEIELPAGYYGTLQYQLASIFCIHYGIQKPSIDIEAKKRLARIKRLNQANVKTMRNDFCGRKGKYNSLTDSWS